MWVTKTKRTYRRRSLAEMGIRELTAKLDHEFSIWTRLSNAQNGFCTRISCGKVAPWKEMDAGHYISRAIKATRWDRRNVQPQCPKCNRFLEGQKHLFRQGLLLKFGEDEVLELEEHAKKQIQLTKDWLIKQIADYKAKNKLYMGAL